MVHQLVRPACDRSFDPLSPLPPLWTRPSLNHYVVFCNQNNWLFLKPA